MQELLVGGNALVDFMEELKFLPWNVSLEDSEKLFQLMKKALLNLLYA